MEAISSSENAVLLPCSFFLSPFGDVPTVMIIQSVLGGAAVYLAGACGARLGGRRAGLLSALLLCVCRFHIFYTPFMLLEVLQSFWMALIAWLAMKAHERNRWRDWVLLGLCCGCSTLTRGNALLFMPGFALMLVLKNWRQSGMSKANARLRCLAMLFVFVVVFYLVDFVQKQVLVLVET